MHLLTLLIIDVIGVSLAIVFRKEILDLVHSICKDIRRFIENRTGFFTILFLILFFLEQLILLVGVHFFRVSLQLQTFIGIFALVVITTATLQKFVWEYKYNYARNFLKDFSRQNEEFLSKIKMERRNKIEQ